MWVEEVLLARVALNNCSLCTFVKARANLCKLDFESQVALWIQVVAVVAVSHFPGDLGVRKGHECDRLGVLVARLRDRDAFIF